MDDGKSERSWCLLSNKNRLLIGVSFYQIQVLPVFLLYPVHAFQLSSQGMSGKLPMRNLLMQVVATRLLFTSFHLIFLRNS